MASIFVYDKTTSMLSCEISFGVRLHLDTGQSLIDGMSSWWCAIHGYNHKDLNDALIKQVNIMSHVMFGGITHDPAIQLCRLLVELTNPKLECVFCVIVGLFRLK